LSFDRPTVLSPAARLLSLRYAVHERATKGGYREGDVQVCVHRASDRDKPRVWTLDRPTYAILDALQRRIEPSLTATLHRIAREQGFALDAAFVDRFCTKLSSFIEGGLVLGSE
jgi:hypothetical protein